jgi:hypothetical protein
VLSPRLEYLCRTTDVHPPTPDGRSGQAGPDKGPIVARVALVAVPAMQGGAPPDRIPVGAVRDQRHPARAATTTQMIDRVEVPAAGPAHGRHAWLWLGRHRATDGPGATPMAALGPAAHGAMGPVQVVGRLRGPTTMTVAEVGHLGATHPGAIHEPCPPKMATGPVDTTRLDR